MKKTNKKILIIGGLGHWSNKTYLPALNDKFCLNNNKRLLKYKKFRV